MLESAEMQLVINYKKCLKSGQCSYLHPELIKADPDGTPRVIAEQIGDDLREAAEEAADLCPSGAITLVEE
jgi:ferredoxin